jgi:hypothetical protein
MRSTVLLLQEPKAAQAFIRSAARCFYKLRPLKVGSATSTTNTLGVSGVGNSTP